MIRRIGIAVILLGLAATVWMVGIEPGMLRVREYTVHLASWPKARDGYRVAFITDLHVGSPHITLATLRTIVDRTNALRPDLILLGGDHVIQGVVGGTAIDSQDIAALLAELRARDGVFGVLGNHDRLYDAERMLDAFAELGIPQLEDSAVRIGRGEAGFWLAGISDFGTGPHAIGKAMQDITDDAPVLVLTHSPDIFPALPDRVALTFAGHTHGGQVYVPLLGRPVVPSEYGQRFAKGLVKEGSKQIFISSGIGTSIIPVRFLTPPEISVITLRTARTAP